MCPTSTPSRRSGPRRPWCRTASGWPRWPGWPAPGTRRPRWTRPGACWCSARTTTRLPAPRATRSTWTCWPGGGRRTSAATQPGARPPRTWPAWPPPPTWPPPSPTLARATLTFRAQDVPGLGYRSYLAEPAPEPAGDSPDGWAPVGGAAVETDAFRIEADPARGGTLSRILDKRSGTELLAGPGNEL